jgi:hypothetical protein
MERSGGSEAPRLFAPLPASAEDHSATFEQCLTTLIDLLGAQRPQMGTGRRARWEWQGSARRSVAIAMRTPKDRSPLEEWFEPLVRAAVYDPNPSFNRQLIDPAMAAFGRRRVQVRLLRFLAAGTNAERAGAARAWYWTQVPLSYPAGSRTPTRESKAEYEEFADLRREFRDTSLQVFITNEDIDVRRYILPGLNLRANDYPEELRASVAQAIHIARTHPDEYLRHRVEHQV